MQNTNLPDAYQQPSREWWAQRWIDVLESFGFARRLARARVYAREGNVLSIEFKGAKVIARVQGTAPEPYKVTLSLDPFSEEQWGYIVETMAERAIFSAKMLAGEMPQTIEEVFTSNGLSLFPFTKFDIHSRCTCPDPANPCKHIGAVYYLLGDRFSEDPFVLFQLRGRTKDQIIEDLRQKRSREKSEDDVRDQIHSSTEAGEHDFELEAQNQTDLASQHSTLNLQTFWQYDKQLESSLVVIAPPPSSETVLDVLGAIPFKPNPAISAADAQASSQAAMEYLKTIYQDVSQQAILAAMRVETSADS